MTSATELFLPTHTRLAQLCAAQKSDQPPQSDLRPISRATLIGELSAILDCINRQPNADIVWMLPPHQAEAVHETVQDRLQTLIDHLQLNLL